MNRQQPARQIDQPEPGWFRLRLAKGAPPVGARVFQRLGVLAAEINGETADVETVWTSGEWIDEAEYRRLIGNPPADPSRPVDLKVAAPPDFEPTIPAVTRNAPVVDLAAALDPAALAAWLEHEYAAHDARVDTLTASYERFLPATAAGIGDEAMAGRATDLARMMGAAVTETDATRKRIKDPVLHAQRLIDGTAKKITDRLASMRGTVEQRITGFLIAKEAEARRVAEAEAARLELEAAELARAGTEDTAAEAAAEEAFHATRHALASAAELSRTHTQNGGVTSLRANWRFEVIDIEQVPQHWLMLNDKLVSAAIRTGTRSIPGLRIFNDVKATIR
jgi:hypothetical protein